MGGISVGGGGHGGKKSVDSEVPLVPFIDLLLCCIMFLLVTAVWNQLARINASQAQPGKPPEDAPPPEEKIELILKVSRDGYRLTSTDGTNIDIPKVGDKYDEEELLDKLDQRRQLEPSRKDIVVAPEDGVEYQTLVRAMDMVVGKDFTDMSLRDGATVL